MTYYKYHDMVDFKELEGKTILGIEGAEEGSGEIKFITDLGSYAMMHFQDCCENVEVKEIDSNLQDLIGQVVIEARVESSDDRDGVNANESYTWTFYHIRTHKTSVCISWLGVSNGYYSEEVDFIKIKEE